MVKDDVAPAGHRRLVVTLLTLVVIIVGLIIAMVFVSYNNSEHIDDINGHVDDIGEVFPDNGPPPSQIEVKLQELALSDGDVREKISYLENMLRKGSTEDGVKLSKDDVFLIELTIVGFCLELEDGSDKALAILAELETTEKSKRNLAQVYSMYVRAYGEIGDTEKLEEYIKKYNENMQQIYETEE